MEKSSNSKKNDVKKKKAGEKFSARPLSKSGWGFSHFLKKKKLRPPSYIALEPLLLKLLEFYYLIKFPVVHVYRFLYTDTAGNISFTFLS